MDLALSVFRASVREVAILLFEPFCARNVFEEVWEEVSHGRGARSEEMCHLGGLLVESWHVGVGRRNASSA